VYNRLKAKDARGKEVTARMEVVSSSRLAVVVEDAGAVYPVRIDPTFSAANWVSFGGMAGVDGDGDERKSLRAGAVGHQLVCGRLVHLGR
jgi:hypothetical protein